MIPAPSYDQIGHILNEESFKFGEGYANGVPQTTRTIGFIIFDQSYWRNSIKDVVGNLDMLNVHSGTNMHFFLCGVSKYGANDTNGRELGELEGVKLYHNAAETCSFVEAFEREIPGWSYELGFDLILVDVVEDEGRNKLDFSSTVFFKVEELIQVGIIERPSEIFGKLVKFARNGEFENAAAFRDELRMVFGINWLKGLILAMFPKSVGNLARTNAALGGGASLPK